MDEDLGLFLGQRSFVIHIEREECEQSKYELDANENSMKRDCGNPLHIAALFCSFVVL